MEKWSGWEWQSAGGAGVLIALLSMVHLGGLAAAASPVASVVDLPRITSVEDLMPGARYYVRDVAKVKRGEKVLVVADRSIHPLVTEALQRAAVEQGAEVNVIVLNGKPELKTVVELTKLEPWMPEWVYTAMAESNVIFTTAFSRPGNEPMYKGMSLSGWMRQQKIRQIKVWQAVPEALGHKPWVTFPDELAREIIKAVLRQVPKGTVKVQVTDPNGTHITFEEDFTEEIERIVKTGYEPEIRGIFHFSATPKQANGVIVAYDSHYGPMGAGMKLVVENNLLVKTEGGGEYGDWLRGLIEKYKNTSFQGGDQARPGLHWLVECAFEGQPKYVNVYDPQRYTFSSFTGGAYADRRAGAVHFGVGSGGGRLPDTGRGFHIDFQMYHATYTINGKKLIDNGHLLALDDPEVRRVASKHGSPDLLLKEDWNPPLDKPM